MKEKRWLETGDIAADLEVGRETVAKWLDAGLVAYWRPGERGHRRVKREDYEEFKARYEREPLFGKQITAAAAEEWLRDDQRAA